MKILDPIRKYNGFDTMFIKSLAEENGYTFITSANADHDESGLYVNEVTHTEKRDLLKFALEDLECEYYTANFMHISYGEMSKELSSTLKSRESTNEARYKVQIFSIKLPYNVESVYVESRTNVTLNNILGISSVSFKEVDRINLEGDFSAFFRVYVPKGEEVNAFTILAPNIMILLLEQAGDYDFEFAGNRIYFYQTFGYIAGDTTPLKITTYKELLEFGTKSAKNIVRASRPVTVEDNFIPMWKLYSVNTIVSVLFIFGGLFYLFIVFVLFMTPLLWPLLLLLLAPLFVKYRLLIKRKNKLITNWLRNSTNIK
jgi:hypothetical protein